MTDIQEISAEAFRKKIGEGETLTVLDVRTGVECRTESLDYPYIHIPLHLLDPSAFVKNHRGPDPVYILCRSGGRARKAAESLVAAGLQKAVIVTGGIGACKSCGVNIKAGQTLSLERQVRIAAGALVLAGVALGSLIDSHFYILSGAVGAGLIFAGITDWCGMALLLARAPWNTDKTQAEITRSIEKFNEKGA